MIEIEAWLKNSIIGIVFLGALGSILAVPLLRAIEPLWKRLMEKIVLAHVIPFGRTNYELGFMDSVDKKSMLIVFLTKTLTAFLLAFWVSLVAVIILVSRLTSGGGNTTFQQSMQLFLR